jgi:membrane protease subunit HflK
MAKKYREPPEQIDPKEAVGLAVILLATLLVAYTAYSGAFKVRAHEQAVILRFGAYDRIVGPGLHFKIPFIEQRLLVDMSDHTLRLPWGEQESDGALSIDRGDESASLVLTGDLYAAVVEWNVMWRVKNPRQFLFSIEDQDVESIIVAVARSTMNRAIGDYAADEALTSKRAEIGLTAVSAMRSELEKLDCGVDIFDLQMQRIVPPQRVKPAFDEVNASIQKRDQLVNEARREQFQLLPAAEAQRDRLVREAQGYAARQSAEAEGEINALMAKYEAYRLAPDVSRQRLYLEAMERIFSQSGPKVILDGKLNGMVPYLNLGSSENPPLLRTK